MIFRNKKPNDVHEGKWNGLGGKLESGESPEECVIREMKEESGLTVRNPKLVGLLTAPDFANDEDWYLFIYVITDFEGKLIDSPEGTLEWIDDDKLQDLSLWEADYKFLKWIEEGKFFSIKTSYQAGKLISDFVTFH